LGGSPTSTKSPYLKKQYNEKRMKKIERKLPKNIQLLKRAKIQRAIAEIITNPNET
jgi:hypothetical protein